ncbi:CRP/FNR family transcriptional regulator [Roseovarius sp. MBR-154]|jgi:CRP-like cAMP-binding protein
MATSCRNCPLRKLPLFDSMSDNEVDFMENFKSGELAVEPGTTLMLEGSNSPQLYTVLEGMGLRYKTMASGARQVLNIVLPGDFVGLQAGVMKEMQHSVEATTAMTLCVFERKSLWSLFRDQPARAYDLTWIAAVEEHFLGESLALLGHMSGIERVARALVRLHDRGVALGLAEGGTMPLPYRQQDLADALGLSLVHTNKTLKQLREDRVVVWRNGTLRILDYERLYEVAGVEGTRDVITRPLI